MTISHDIPQPKYNLNDPVHKKCDKRIRLVRKTLPGVFAFEYRLPTSTGEKKMEFILGIYNLNIIF